ncbi:MAG: xylose isomerase [Naasia sp.]|jgi:sugar phosphate isomerase/epimerase|uniref:sugar phosphate isomerase/epimerase family protein n=1 Tax=Naasia sp. TaxID=2546198 RepID=UPI002626648E|nr:sugar phosphate isomerase/epimerase [Naasia sp.]MCU1569767.1 xylose isomerase [Naasia sp.]
MTSSTLSLQLYSVRDAIAADLRSALQRVADLGFRQVELFGFVDRADEYSALLPQLSLTVPSAHARLLGEDQRAIFAAARMIGVGTVIDPFIEPERWTTREGVLSVADDLNAAAELAADAGVRLGYHNHWFEFADIGGATALEVLADRLDPAVVLELDAYWAVAGGADPVRLLGSLGDRVRFLHVKDGPGTRETREQVPAGQGAIDVPALLQAAPDALRVIEFDDYAGDVFDGVRASVEYLVGQGEQL